MSEMGRDLWEMGKIVKPKHYQNKNIEGDEDFQTKELICKQYCLTSLSEVEYLFVYSNAQNWADAEMKERLTYPPVNPGIAWKIRRDLWEQFLVGEEIPRFDYTYSERMNQAVYYNFDRKTLLDAVAKLLVDDPDTRKAIIPIFGNREDELSDINYLDGSARIPCSMYYDFLLRDGKLNICYHERSSDFITHFGNDVYLAWKLMEAMCHRINELLPEDADVVEPGYLYHTIDSLHAYKKDWVKLKSNIDDLVK